MAFLCPVRIRRNKKKKDDDESNMPQLGRITGSSSIETLVRVGIEKEAGLSPEARMVVLHDFMPCVDDELEVKRGDLVYLLYRENDWAYVLDEKKHNEGFIPESYIATFKGADKESRSKKISREPSQGTSSMSSTTPSSTHSQQPQQPSPVESIPEMHPFYKDPSGRFIVLYTFIARDENDVTVQRGEMITVLNRDDPDWFWIVRSDGQEGFVPSAFVYPPNQINDTEVRVEGNDKDANGANGSTEVPQAQAAGKIGAELVMLYDYKAQVDDDLSVRRGDWVYADLSNQTVEGWLWAYAPKQRKSGFIPKAYARPPAMTSL